jgi:hypothetical protein
MENVINPLNKTTTMEEKTKLTASEMETKIEELERALQVTRESEKMWYKNYNNLWKEVTEMRLTMKTLGDLTLQLFNKYTDKL